MPKYKITEVDNTGAPFQVSEPNIVYIPGSSKVATATEPRPAKLYRSWPELKASTVAEGYDVKDASYALARRLLELGMQVIYQGFQPADSRNVSVDKSTGEFTITFDEKDVVYTYNNGIVTNASNPNYEAHCRAVTGSLSSFALENGTLAVINDGAQPYVVYPARVDDVSSHFYLDNGVEKVDIGGVTYLVEDNGLTPVGGEFIEANNGYITLGDGDGEIVRLDYMNDIAYYKVVDTHLGGVPLLLDSRIWKELEDKNLYNVRFLTTGAYACPTVDMVKCAANRGDCIALIDHTDLDTYSVDAVREQVEILDVDYTDTRNADALSFAAAFTPWFNANLPSMEITSGTVRDLGTESYTVPASFGYLLAYARSIKTNPIWKASAGVSRGVIPELTSVKYILSNAECEMLQARAKSGEVDLDGTDDNVGIAINPIAYRRYNGFSGGFRYVVNGNRTMHENDGTTIATSFLNVRVLVSEISKTLYDASVAYTFEQNSDVLWNKFYALVTPLLDRMASGEGIEGYRLERVATDKKARFCANLTIVPIEAVEDFELTITLEDSIEVTE